MEKLVAALLITMLVYLCIYATIDRVCKCIEHHAEYKYRSKADADRSGVNSSAKNLKE